MKRRSSRWRRGLSDNEVTYYPDHSQSNAHITGNISGAIQVLVDNSVRSGATIGRAVDCLSECGIRPSHFIKLVDYQDGREPVVRDLLESHGMEGVSLYTRKELAGSPYHSFRDWLQVATNRLLLPLVDREILSYNTQVFPQGNYEGD